VRTASLPIGAKLYHSGPFSAKGHLPCPRVPTGPDLIAVDDAAKEYEVGVTTLYRYMRQGRLVRYQKLPDRRTFIDRRELERLFEPRVKPT
jgi:Helix-turn-helix domain